MDPAAQHPPDHPESELLSGTDRFWLRMDSPDNLMKINGVMLFDEPIDLARLRQVASEPRADHSGPPTPTCGSRTTSGR